MDEDTTEGTVPKQLLPHVFKKGQSGNPAGRPPGPSLKEWAKVYLAAMTPEERLDFMEGIPKETVWKMAEGNPKQDTDTNVTGNLVITVAPEIADKNALNTSTVNDSQG